MRSTSESQPKSRRRALSAAWLVVALFLVAGFAGAILLQGRISVERMNYLVQVRLVSHHFDSLADGQVEIVPPKILDSAIWTFSNPQTLTWRVRSAPNSAYTDYVWQLFALSPELSGLLAERGIPANDWWREWALEHGPGPGVQLRAIMIPANEAALEVHKELGLPLPEGFSVEMVAGE